MTVLVCAASKHGSTAEIAQAIGAALAKHGVPVDVRPVEDVTIVDGYDAVVLGSAVYMGRWLEPARRLVEAEAPALAARPVWLFSSGPVSNRLEPEEGHPDIAAIVEATGAREHRIFAGRVRRQGLSFTERAMVAALRVPDSDYRDWAGIEAWAADIANTLRSQAEVPSSQAEVDAVTAAPPGRPG
jgi:menaquinone-dependent protoporphyrinogen oxidase